MTLRKKGGYWYGDSQADIRDELRRYSVLNGYEATQFADAACACGGRVFLLDIDADEGVAIRQCKTCRKRRPMGNSEDYLEDASPEQCGCPCDEDEFEITVGIALYEASEDVRWFYVGCRCDACGLTAVYGDWKNEFIGFRALLDRV